MIEEAIKSRDELTDSSDETIIEKPQETSS